ncbi:MAG: hypothetical protein HY581_07160 [Nitrospirae bacterium]|jgi:hypothetical protein|nr:hypothetical protein [Nitrospirota bacterium]
MTPEELKAVLTAVLDHSAGMTVWQIFALVAASAVAAFFGAYLSEKARSVATKEDIAEITSKIENVKRSVDAIRTVDVTKYQLKYEACLEALRIIDAHLSHSLAPPPDGKLAKQHASTEEVRSCHSRLVLACESTELIEQFARIMFKPRTEEETNVPPTDKLNTFRNLVRKELGFGNPLNLDRERAWFGHVISEKN